MSDMPKVIWAMAPHIREYDSDPPVNAEDHRFLTEYIRRDLSAPQPELDAVREENMRLREALDRIEDLTSHNMPMTADEEQCVNRQARAALKR